MSVRVKQWAFKIVGNAAHPSISRTNTLFAELPTRHISQCSVYIRPQSPEKKTEETSEQLWRKKIGRASRGYKCFSTVLLVVSVWPLQSISVSTHLTHFQEKVDTPGASLLLSFFSSFPSSCWFDFHVLFIWSALRFFAEPLSPLRSLPLSSDRLAVHARRIFKV